MIRCDVMWYNGVWLYSDLLLYLFIFAPVAVVIDVCPLFVAQLRTCNEGLETGTLSDQMWFQYIAQQEEVCFCTHVYQRR